MSECVYEDQFVGQIGERERQGEKAVYSLGPAARVSGAAWSS